MFSLAPWREGSRTRALLPRLETPFRLLEEFEPVFERFFGTCPTPVEEWEPIYRGLHMTETEKEYLVRAELPGFEPSEVMVTLLGNVLTIEAKHGEEPKESEPEVKERRYAHVKRAISLPGAWSWRSSRRPIATACWRCICPRRRRSWHGASKSRREAALDCHSDEE
jgi:HSP20 family protein